MSQSRTVSPSGKLEMMENRLHIVFKMSLFVNILNQIWAGTDNCEPVTWQECKLVPKDVQFIVPDVTCSNKQELWYHEPAPSTGTKMTNTFTCEVKKSSHCTTQTRPDCKQITWNECK